MRPGAAGLIGRVSAVPVIEAPSVVPADVGASIDGRRRVVPVIEALVWPRQSSDPDAASAASANSAALANRSSGCLDIARLISSRTAGGTTLA
nr:hypothetical protein GCM10020092_089270 [Actinoplanes digitatis]